MTVVYLGVLYRDHAGCCTEDHAGCCTGHHAGCGNGHHAGCGTRVAWWVWYPVAWWVSSLPTMVGIPSSLLYASHTTLGIPSIPPCTGPSVHRSPLITRCTVRGHQAQNGRNPWVRASQRLKVRKGVMREGSPLRIITPLLPHERTERLDAHRVTLPILPMVRHLRAQCSSHPPSDRCEKSGIPPTQC